MLATSAGLIPSSSPLYSTLARYLLPAAPGAHAAVLGHPGDHASGAASARGHDGGGVRSRGRGDRRLPPARRGPRTRGVEGPRGVNRNLDGRQRESHRGGDVSRAFARSTGSRYPRRHRGRLLVDGAPDRPLGAPGIDRSPVARRSRRGRSDRTAHCSAHGTRPQAAADRRCRAGGRDRDRDGRWRALARTPPAAGRRGLDTFRLGHSDRHDRWAAAFPDAARQTRRGRARRASAMPGSTCCWPP
jgi:hypothetical protein